MNAAIEKISVFVEQVDTTYHVNIPEVGMFKARRIKEIDHISRTLIRASGRASFFTLDIQIEYKEMVEE